MASSSAACSSFLRLSPPPTSARPPPPPLQLVPRGRSDEAAPLSVRRRLCAAGAATIVVIGLGGGYVPTFMAGNPGRAGGAIPDGMTGTVALVKPERSRNEGPRWSDSIQGCPPWRPNSIQVVVPENLPRPSARRRWEHIGNPGAGAPASASSTTAARNPGCFSM